jgi:hypothetical protein
MLETMAKIAGGLDGERLVIVADFLREVAHGLGEGPPQPTHRRP